MRWLRRIAIVLLAAIAIVVGSTPFLYPALAAAVCPSCYDMERIAPGVVVSRDMDAERRLDVMRDVEASREIARAWFRRPEAWATVLACATEACDRRLGGRGARATTYGTFLGTVIRVSPRGLGRTILTHEFAHVAFHRHIGLFAQITGGVPAWFDEGLAVIVSGDERYLWPDGRAKNCDAPDPRPLPASPFEWASRAGREQDLYARAACRTDAWLAANGGREGLLAALAVGKRVP